MNRRGRPTSAASMVGRLKSGPVAKERLLVLIGNLAGVLPVAEACRRLEMSRTLFRRIRKALLVVGLRAVEPRPRGRPVRETPRHERTIAQLQDQVRQLEEDLHFAKVREELALLVPWTVRRQKKMRQHRRKAACVMPQSKPHEISAAAETSGPILPGDSA
jgi:hypothetical protein